MALASWAGLYTPAVQNLMRQKRTRELLLLQAIAGHCDPFGFSWPGDKALLRLMRCSESTLARLMDWLESESYIRVYENYHPRRGRMERDIQVNPCVLYVREEIQSYCEALWAGAERDFAQEKTWRGNLFSTKDSQPESLPDSVTRDRNQKQNQRAKSASTDKKPMGGTHAHRPQGAAPTGRLQTPQGKRSRTDDAVQGSAQPTQRGNAQDRKDESAGRIVKFTTMDDEDLAQTIALTVSTRIEQARAAVATYPRPAIESALQRTAARRAQGNLNKPGGYFFRLLQGDSAPPPTNYPVNQDLE